MHDAEAKFCYYYFVNKVNNTIIHYNTLYIGYIEKEREGYTHTHTIYIYIYINTFLLLI